MLDRHYSQRGKEETACFGEGKEATTISKTKYSKQINSSPSQSTHSSCERETSQSAPREKKGEQRTNLKLKSEWSDEHGTLGIMHTDPSSRLTPLNESRNLFPSLQLPLQPYQPPLFLLVLLHLTEQLQPVQRSDEIDSCREVLEGFGQGKCCRRRG